MLDILVYEKELNGDLAQLAAGICWEGVRSLKKNKKVRNDVLNMLGLIGPTIGTEELAINVVKLVQKDEAMAEHFAEAIELWERTEKVHNFVHALLQEIMNITETTAQKGLVTLLQSLGRRIPHKMSASWVMLEELIAISDVKYWAREAVLAVIAEIYIELEKNGYPDVLEQDSEHDELNMSQVDNALDESTDDDLPLKERCFRRLTAHIHDKNSFVRSYTINIFKRLTTQVF